MKFSDVDSSTKDAGMVVEAINKNTQSDDASATSLLEEMRALNASVVGMQDLLRQSEKIRRLEFALVHARSFYPMTHPISGKTVEPRNLQRVYSNGAANGRFHCQQFIMSTLSIFRKGLGVYLPNDVIYAKKTSTPLTKQAREAARLAFQDIIVHHFHFLLGTKPRLVEDAPRRRTMMFYD